MQYSRAENYFREGLTKLMLLGFATLPVGPTGAAPAWLVPNTPTSAMVGLYHFDRESSRTQEATVRTGVPAGTYVTFQQNHASLDQAHALEHYNFNAAGVGTFHYSPDVPFTHFGAASLGLDGTVQLREKSVNASVNDNDYTVEAWVKWEASNASADLILGGSDRSLRLVRDAVNPANDAIGFQGSHGVWRPHPGFAGFANLQQPVVDGQWFHVAMVIHNTGMHEHSGHYHYEDGSFAMFFINGELVGSGTADRIDISEEDEELVFHASDRIQIRSATSQSRVLVDEFTVWHDDPTAGGTVTTGLFLDGRGGTPPVLEWTQSNQPDTSRMVGLYHFDSASSVPLEATVRTGVPAGTYVNHQLNHPSLNQAFALELYNFNSPDAGGADLSFDVATSAFEFSSLALSGTTHYRAKTANTGANSNHYTVEAWVKWDDSNTSADLILGGSDRSLRVIRDAANPANDAIGFQGSHGVWRPHPGFTGFSNVADGQWFHVAMVIHNTGMHEHSGHYHYEDGSFAMFFINGELVGSGTADRIDISEDDEELVFHASDRIQVRSATSQTRILVDEFTVWHDDPTAGGTVTTGLFLDGRGGTSSVENWMLFE